MNNSDFFFGQHDYLKSFRFIIRIIAYFFCLLYVALYFYNDGVINESVSWIILIIVFIKLCLVQRSNSIEFSLDVALIYLFYIPCLVFTVKIGSLYNIFLAISVLIFDSLKYAARKMKNHNVLIGEPLKSNNYYSNIYIWSCLLAMTFVNGFIIPRSSGSVIGLFAYIFPFSISLIYFERFIPYLNTRRIYIILGVYFASVSFYAVFYWSGFGRLVIGAFLLIPFLVADSYRDMKIRIWHIMIFAPFALTLSQFSRYGAVNADELHGGSASHHLILSLELLKSLNYFQGQGWSEFWGQWSLILLNWFPREAWYSKSEAVGLTFVDDWIGREGYPEGYSVSLGYLGEQFFLLGSWWPVGIIIQLVTILTARRMVLRLSGKFMAPLVAFDVCLISYIWGGGGIFGSRAWFMVMPMLILIFLFRLKISSSKFCL